MSRFVRGLFQTARTISTIDPTASYEHRGEAPPPPLFVVCTTLEHMFRSILLVLFSSMFRRVVLYNCAHARVLIKGIPVVYQCV